MRVRGVKTKEGVEGTEDKRARTTEAITSSQWHDVVKQCDSIGR